MNHSASNQSSLTPLSCLLAAVRNAYSNQCLGIEQPRQPKPASLILEKQEKHLVAETIETPPSQQKRKRSMEAPDWLPKDWNMIIKTRTSGASAGATDKYYIDPVSGYRFRSRNEVTAFLETGSKGKKKQDTAADATKSENPKDPKEKKKKKSASKSKKPAPWNFDFQNPPEEVNWSLVDATQGVWRPSIGDQQVPESSTQEWSTTFERVSDMNTST